MRCFGSGLVAVAWLAAGGWILRGSRGRRRSWDGRIDPASMHAPVQAIGRFGVDRIGVQNQAAECHLDMAARAAETVVKVEVAKGGIEVVTPQKAHNTPAEPNTFRITRRPVKDALRFGKFVNFLRFLGAVLGAVFGGVLGPFFGACFRCRRLL